MRISVQLFLFFVFMNAFAGVLQSQGIDDDLGISPDPGGDEQLEDAQDEVGNFSASDGGGETLFGLRLALGGVFEGLLNQFPAVDMLKNAGAPDFLVNWGFAGYSALIGFDVVGYLRNGTVLE